MNDPGSPPLTVIIPAYNERDTILETLKRVLAVPIVAEVIVVDDGSDDGTTDLLKSVTDCRVRVLYRGVRSGKGAAIRTAIPEARGKLVVIQDADMEYNPDQLPSLADPILQERAQVVYGSRFRGRIQGMRWMNRLGNRLLTLAANILYGARITDEATCYKMFRTELLQNLKLRCVRFEFCPEVTARLLRQGIPILEVPIDYVGRDHAAGKKIRWWDFVSALWTLARYRVCG